jgi:hypothetical protein
VRELARAAGIVEIAGEVGVQADLMGQRSARWAPALASLVISSIRTIGCSSRAMMKRIHSGTSTSAK